MNRMFLRIMAVVMAAILLLTVSLSLISYFTVRSQRINARLEYLASEATDIAYLAASESSSSFSDLFYSLDTRTLYLNWKAKKVNDEFGAYIAVVDRWGSVMDNIETAYREDPDFVSSLSGEEISEAIQKVLTGESIRVQSMVGGAPTFTVGVPFLRYGSVAGAVLIQTKAQRIQSGMEDLIWMISAAALTVLVISGVAVSLYVRGIMKPLGALTKAAGDMANGNFTRVDENKGDPELRKLCGVFNTMSEKLQEVENSRREFVANVSHELRSPITSIRGFAEGMADGVIPAEEHPKYLRLVAEESRRLSSLIGELLELSRLEREDAKLNPECFDINEMLRRAVIRRMNDLDGKQAEAECRFADDPCTVNADSARIEEVVINLLDNAIKFTGEKGKIILETRRQKERTEVTVWDSGISVPEEDRGKIFDRFFTSDRAHTSGKGTGLGLSICQRIMDMHGQSIRLLDEAETRAYGEAEGGGAAFRFTLANGEMPHKEDG